jgi:GNAT superfamily N-acetyltransferase
MTEWFSEPLAAWHSVSSFDSGQASLDEWLRSTGHRAQRADTARTYVWTRDGENVAAYYSIAPTHVRRGEIPRQATGGFSHVPAYLLARLALTKNLQGQGLGAELLVDALGRIVDAATRSGGRLIVVDAIDAEAVNFYRHHDFKPVDGVSNRLYMKVSSARHALGIGTVSVTASEEAQLFSLVLKAPDGQSWPVVMSPTEARAVARRVVDAASHSSGGAGVTVELSEIITEVLGRDPFDAEG